MYAIFILIVEFVRAINFILERCEVKAMLIGNPDNFALMLEIVPEWCSDNFVQGIFYVYVNGVIYPDTLRTTTLNSEIYGLLEDNSPFLNPQIDKELYNLEADELFKEICNITFPKTETADNNYSYSIPLVELSNAGVYLFIVASENEVKIIIGKHDEENELTYVDEAKVSMADFEYIKQRLHDYYADNIKC